MFYFLTCSLWLLLPRNHGHIKSGWVNVIPCPVLHCQHYLPYSAPCRYLKFPENWVHISLLMGLSTHTVTMLIFSSFHLISSLNGPKRKWTLSLCIHWAFSTLPISLRLLIILYSTAFFLFQVLMRTFNAKSTLLKDTITAIWQFKLYSSLSLFLSWSYLLKQLYPLKCQSCWK